MDQATGAHAPHFTPVRGRDRIEVLDILRGFAILAIFYMNIPFMAGPIGALLGDMRSMGWSPADQTAWALVTVTLEGTQRGMLEFLFGAGLMVTAAKAMEPTGPVAVADLYIRRNLWLLLFGLFDIFILLWPGDILHVYALCALGLFPFRHLRPRWLISIGLVFSLFVAVGGVGQYVGRTMEQRAVASAEVKTAQGKPLTKEEQEAVKEWRKLEERISGKDPTLEKLAKDEAKGRSGTMADYAQFLWSGYFFILGKGGLLFGVIEAFGTMLIGIALWKLGFIQGRAETRTYLIAMVVMYALGMTARYVGAMERLTFEPIPKTIWATSELARIAVSIGHVAAINLLVRAATGRRLLAPFKAAGQVAFSLYFLQQIIGVFIMYSPIGLHLPSAPGWASLFWQASAVIAILLVLANIWLRFFVSGPLEWVWRSLTYGERQPFRRYPAPQIE